MEEKKGACVCLCIRCNKKESRGGPPLSLPLRSLLMSVASMPSSLSDSVSPSLAAAAAACSHLSCLPIIHPLQMIASSSTP